MNDAYIIARWPYFSVSGEQCTAHLDWWFHKVCQGPSAATYSSLKLRYNGLLPPSKLRWNVKTVISKRSSVSTYILIFGRLRIHTNSCRDIMTVSLLLQVKVIGTDIWMGIWKVWPWIPAILWNDLVSGIVGDHYPEEAWLMIAKSDHGVSKQMDGDSHVVPPPHGFDVCRWRWGRWWATTTGATGGVVHDANAPGQSTEGAGCHGTCSRRWDMRCEHMSVASSRIRKFYYTHGQVSCGRRKHKEDQAYWWKFAGGTVLDTRPRWWKGFEFVLSVFLTKWLLWMKFRWCH